MDDSSAGGGGVTLGYDDSEETARTILEGLQDFNRKAADYESPQSVNVALRDGAGKVRGGIVARMSLDTVYLDLVWIDETLRGHGHGRALIAMVEQRARSLGARQSWLSTFSWQARPFYEGLGYSLFGELSLSGGAHALYLLRKPL